MTVDESVASKVVGRWSRRLPFQPRGEDLAYRTELRAAIERLPKDDRALAATYSGPDPARADLENVLFYNVGTVPFRGLGVGGVTARRLTGDDVHVSEYEVVTEAPSPGDGREFGQIEATFDGRTPSTLLAWWSLLRPRATRASADVHDGEFVLDVEICPPEPLGHRVFTQMKPLLDAAVSAFHAHDGSRADPLVKRLPDQWADLVDDSSAVLGTRALVRPSATGVVWNPADDRCAAFRIRPVTGDPRVVVSLRAGG